jgi:hypothetical protein
MISNPFRPANSPTSSNTASSLKLLLKDPSFCSGHLLVPFPASCISAGSGIDATRLTPSDHVKVHLFRPKGRPFITDKQALESFPPPSDGAEALVHQSPHPLSRRFRIPRFLVGELSVRPTRLLHRGCSSPTTEVGTMG